jgi:hypothetical protein
MHEDPTLAALDLADDLRRYFALTTAVALPAAVRRVDARMLAGQRRTLTVGGRPVGALLGGLGALAAATAAIVILIAGHPFGTPGTAASSFAANPGTGALAMPAAVIYPGVDVAALAGSGTTVSSPAGHGASQVTAAQAQAAAVTAQVNAAAPGPAVLVWAQLGAPAPGGTCLCWIVDVPIQGGVANDSKAVARPGIPPAQTVLVFVDAATGRVVDTLSAPGIP